MTIPVICTPALPAYQSRSVARLTELLAAIDRFITWWGAHRAWPANEPARIDHAR